MKYLLLEGVTNMENDNSKNLEVKKNQSDCHSSKSSSHGSNHSKHMLMMLLCCLIPIVLIFLLPVLGVTGGAYRWLLLLMCPLMHVGMMLFSKDHRR